MPRREKPGSPRFIVAEVDRREIVYMQENYMEPGDIITWLGLEWSPKPRRSEEPVRAPRNSGPEAV